MAPEHITRRCLRCTLPLVWRQESQQPPLLSSICQLLSWLQPSILTLVQLSRRKCFHGNVPLQPWLLSVDPVLLSILDSFFRVLHTCVSESWHGCWVLANKPRVSARCWEPRVQPRPGNVWVQSFLTVLTDQSLLLASESLLLTNQSRLLSDQSRLRCDQSFLLAHLLRVLPYISILLFNDVSILTNKTSVHSYKSFLLPHDINVLTNKPPVHSYESILLSFDISILTNKPLV